MAKRKDTSKHGMSSLKGIDAYCTIEHQRQRGDRFGRMFTLPPLFSPADNLKALGVKHGPMDAKKSSKARTKTVPVGHIFFGQFLDHDITLDVSSSLTSVVRDATSIGNSRTPSLDLDCVYAQGPEASPYLYHGTGEFKGVKLLTGADGTAVNQEAKFAKDDLSRSAQGTAVIGDPRNDENRVLSQMQLAMIRCHNVMVDLLSVEQNDEVLEGAELFEHARNLLTWHYQWVVIHDYLPAICGHAVVADILGNGRKFYCTEYNDPYIPVEFSVAAYRFGHSMIPMKIQIQNGKKEHDLFGDVLGGGFKPLSNSAGVVNWETLYCPSKKQAVQMAEKLDTKLASILLELPFVNPPDEASLATRNLLRGQGFMLPSGENVARHMDRPDDEIASIQKAAAAMTGKGAGLKSGIPLWLYILIEAEIIGRETKPSVFDKGEGLGPVGARIVAETLLGLMEMDSRSFLAQNRSWHPSEGVGIETIGDLMTFKPVYA